jgi:hypothetical protein
MMQEIKLEIQVVKRELKEANAEVERSAIMLQAERVRAGQLALQQRLVKAEKDWGKAERKARKERLALQESTFALQMAAFRSNCDLQAVQNSMVFATTMANCDMMPAAGGRIAMPALQFGYYGQNPGGWGDSRYPHVGMIDQQFAGGALQYSAPVQHGFAGGPFLGLQASALQTARLSVGAAQPVATVTSAVTGL